VIGFDLYKTTDGGQSWSYASSGLHVDQHDLVSHPSNHNQLVLGNDGGVYVSQNGGQSWSFRNNLPITQFYTCEVDEQLPRRLYGGTQDNGTNRTLQGGLDDWEPIYGGDGFYVLVDPLDNDYVYAEYQYGNLARSTDGGYSFQYALNGIDGSDRKNWNTPVVFDPGNPSVLYYGSNRLYRSVNRAVSWSAISPDLTGGPGGSGVVYGTITTIAASPSDNEWIYAGTDDGNVWRTENGGSSWTNVSEGLPLRWVTRVATDPYDAAVVYATLSGYRYDSYQPHVFRSTSGGDDWTDISGDLPEAPANDIIPDPVMDSVLYVATDFGVFMTFDMGSSWISLGTGLPNVPVVDIELHNPTRKLIAATYGRSMHAFDLGQLTGMPEGSTTLRNLVRIFPNPAGDKLQFSCERAVKTWEIIAANGSVARSGKIPARMDAYTVSLAGMPAGNFLLVLHSGREKWSARFVHRK
jgi:photosystem II stability/assembly factor-like uncharacterized protein